MAINEPVTLPLLLMKLILDGGNGKKVKVAGDKTIFEWKDLIGGSFQNTIIFLHMIIYLAAAMTSLAALISGCKLRTGSAF